jgi:hypothetical protein
VFSASLDRIASADVQEVFESDVASKVAIEVEMRAIQDSDTVTIKVSLDDGAPNMELKYVKGSNPADTAENFIRENNLPYSYLNEIIEYIKANIPEAREYGTYKPTKTSNIQQKEVSFYSSRQYIYIHTYFRKRTTLLRLVQIARSSILVTMLVMIRT